jgi:hypothetical protein
MSAFELICVYLSLPLIYGVFVTIPVLHFDAEQKWYLSHSQR